MTLKIDSTGRMIIPKPIRDRLGIQTGSDLDIQETADGIVLNPAHHRPSLVKMGNFLVHTGTLPAGYDILRALESGREGATARRVVDELVF